LVFVLWVMVVLCAVALDMRFSSHLRLQVTANLGNGARAAFLARAGVERARAELAESRDTVQAFADLRESSERDYQNIELGEGTYTLFVGTDSDGSPVYGIDDESARLHINTAERAVLEKIPGMEVGLPVAIEDARKEQEFRDINDLLLVRGVDMTVLYGEDQNKNGILDPNEDDGDETWPSDNADGHLDGGLAPYITTWSAIRNVDPSGEQRVDLNSASAEELASSVEGISSQQADSIVAHREKNKFTSIAELLDVELVERVEKDKNGQQGNQQPGGQPGTPQNQGQQNAQQQANAQQNPNQGQNANESGKDSGQPKKDSEGKSLESEQGKQPSENKGENGEKPKEPAVATKGTGEKAFDDSAFRQIAGFVSISKEETIEGLVNINTAVAEVLACLPGIEEPVARAIVNERTGRADAFATVADLLDVDGMTQEAFKKVCGHVTARSDVFSVRSFGVVGAGEAVCCARAVIDRTEDATRLLYWQETE
jgi:DNA uptake protein ComE-like DNA-binding protein